MTAALRFLVVLNGGLSSGVKGVFDSLKGLGERRRDLKDSVEEVLLLNPVALLWFACEFAV